MNCVLSVDDVYNLIIGNNKQAMEVLSNMSKYSQKDNTKTFHGLLTKKI